MNFIKEGFSHKNEFLFRLANVSDIPMIVQLMTQVKKAMPQKEWFVDDNAEYLQHLLNGHGFILLAKEALTQHLAAFFMVKFPGLSKDNLGYHLGFSEEELAQCVHMDSCVVHPDFRGQHLQSRLAALAEQHIQEYMTTPAKQQIQQIPYRYLLATVHPDNCYSLNSMLRCGYRIMKETYLYGGLPRIIIMKELKQ